MSHPRAPRKLPLANEAPELAPSPRRHLPLLPEVRPADTEARPSYVVWELTLKCDLRCRHCGSRAGKARDNELTTEEALRLADELSAMGTREVTLIGGETYLHEGWLEVAERLHRHGIEVGILTGGRGMTAERARAAKRAGVTTISVSVDGLRDVHDDVRAKKGSHDAAMAALQNVKDAGLRLTANTQITRLALRQVEPMFEALMDAGIEAWQVSMTVPMGRAADAPELLLQPYQVLELQPMLARITDRARRRGVGVFPGNDIGYFGPYETKLRPEGHRTSCSAGKLGMGIEADGAIKGCPSLPSADYVGGNVRDASLRDIWERAEPLRFTRGRDSSSLWGYCATCYYAEVCLGGCSWTAHVLFGKRGNNPYCHHRALDLLEQGLRERVVRVAKAPGLPFDYGRFDVLVEPWPASELPRVREVVASGEGFFDAVDNHVHLHH